mmetsp:Transcript_68755/g.223893  ORF Transcript_68755/g.223893 Transcript_68755/m.223893 type:complete len:140 (-) Transcript_68755:122-541(-)
MPEHCGGKRAAGFRDHLRFLKYGPGQYFAPHEDGAQTCTGADGVFQRSVFSALLYCSDPEVDSGAGGTRFVAPDCPRMSSPRSPEEARCEGPCRHCVDAPTRKGSILLFAQSLTHAGTEPTSTDKFIMRTDVMFADSQT